MSRTHYSYPSDLSNAEWALLLPLLASAVGRGRPSQRPTRRIADAVFYLLRPGWLLSGRMRLMRGGSGSGRATSEVGVWRCPGIPTGSCSDTG